MTLPYKTKKITLIKDPVTSIGYKIIHYGPEDRYEIWTSYRAKKGATPLRNRIRTMEAIQLQHDVKGLISYVENKVIKNHYNFYENGSFDLSCSNSTTNTNLFHNRKKNERHSIKQENNADTNNHSPILGQNIVLSGSKHQELENLFVKWERAQATEPDDIWRLTKGNSQNITKEHFRRDGIIDEETFAKEKCKVLFLSAEANDDKYSAATNKNPNTVNDYLEYNRTGHEDWKGRMREHLAEMYKVICRIDRNSMTNPEAVLHFSVMDINKRGGRSNMDKGAHIKEYCKRYADFIRAEIDIISPDVVAIAGTSLYDMRLHTMYLGAIESNGKCFFLIGGKKVPILSLWQPCYYQGKCEPAEGYTDNRTIGKQAARCLAEMERFGI